MSEELGGLFIRHEPPASAPAATAPTTSKPADSPATTPVVRPIPGGGSRLAAGDKPGDPFATLVVLAADGLLGEQPFSMLKRLPTGAIDLPVSVCEGLTRCLGLLDSGRRSVLICAGGQTLTHGLMQEAVRRMPSGLDSFGPGRHVEALLKERSAEYGNVWESALLVKALAKRQCSIVRFGSVRVVTAAAMAAYTDRVYARVFADWRVLVGGGACNGGRDEPLDVQVVPVDLAAADAALASRAEASGDASFAKGVEDYSSHPWWPKAVVLTRDASVEGFELEQRGGHEGDEPPAKRQDTATRV